MQAVLGKVKIDFMHKKQKTQFTASECDDPMAFPLPIDFSATGNSHFLGGPIDAQGRLLVRSRILITDMHDGRKKVFLETRSIS